MPKTCSGKWSVWLNSFFLVVITVSVILVKVLGLLSFSDHWWDVTVLVFLASIIAFVLGIVAFAKSKEKSVLVGISVVLGLVSILFLLLHSLFISD